MIKNVVFDFGQVLVHFNPKQMTEKYIEDKDDVLLVEEALFDRLYWDKLDEGTISNEEVLEKVYKRIPDRLHKKAEEIYYNWVYNLPEVDGMRELIKEIKDKYKVNTYLLSNISKYFAEHSSEISILQELDGCIFSATCGFVKPSKEIFKYLCDKYNLVPAETVFIDDNKNNVEAAIEFGIDTYQFNKDVEELKKWLEKKLR
jgi:putative hydrolase of the HAD superfamily